MKKLAILFLCFFCYLNILNAQLQGSEEVVTVQVYRGTFIVNGDCNTYYPVIFKYGNQNRINHLRIYRSYSEPGPIELSPTHRGNLSLEIDVNYGSWGGAVYDWRVMDLKQKYHTTFAGATLGMHNMGFIIWMRGGGFHYHYESEKATGIQVAYSSSELIYDNATNDGYDVYAPSPITEPDWPTINNHKNDHWDFIKEKDLSGSSSVWQQLETNISYNSGNVGIGTTNTFGYKLAVNGIIGAKEVVVETTSAWPDFVFEPDYELMPIADLTTFIKANKHLPEIPTTEEVQENGISVGEMNAKFLEKIEELTLYTIEQQGLINNQKELINGLLERVNKLEGK